MFRLTFFLVVFWLLLIFLGPVFSSWAMLSSFLLGGLWGFSYKFQIRITRGELPSDE